jgi:signal transduction histidine kinase
VETAADGRPARVGGSILDVTRIRDAERERERVEQLMRETQRLETVGTLAAGVAHDFNNLLTAISGNLFLLRDYVPDTHPAAELVAEASIAAERGADLVRRLLAFGRPGRTRRDEVDISALVAETLRLSRVEENDAYEVSLTDQMAPARTLGDATLLQQVVLNLVINAVDAMPGGGRLSLAIEGEEVPETGRLTAVGLAPGRYVTVSVSDTGPGIARGDVGKVFDPFFTTKEVGKGTGLGLWTSLHIARGHQGWIDIAATSEKGTTFKLYLPQRSV